ncbi:MAG: oligosaccharide flippase family protein [Pseudomonadota bacterium]
MINIKNIGNLGFARVVLQSSFLVFLVRAFAAVLVFGLHVYLARSLGVSEYGQFVFYFQLIFIAATVLPFGMDHAIVRFLPAYREKSEKQSEISIVSFGVLLTGLVFVLLVGLTIAAYFIFQDSLKIEFLFVGLLIVFVLASVQVFTSVLRSYRAYFKAQVPPELMYPFLFLTSAFLLWQVFVVQATAISALVCLLIAATISLSTLVYLARGYLPPLKSLKFEGKTWMAVSIPLMAGALVLDLEDRLNIIILDWLLTSSDVGIYSTSNRIGGLSLFLNTAFIFVLGPIISANWFGGERHRVFQAYWLVGVCNCAFAWVIVSAIYFFGDQILAIFGPEFAAGRDAALIFSTFLALSTMAGPVGVLLNMTGHQNILLILIGSAAVLSCTLCYLLVPHLGFEAAAWASGISHLFWRYCAAVYAYFKLVRPTRLAGSTG